MTLLLIKKQLREIFRAYFYDQKRNRSRSKGAVAVRFFLFVLLMAGVLGGLFTFLSASLCGPLSFAGYGWLYFIVMGGMAVLLGAFGSVFNTYSSLYLAKDNDLLFALPIPVNAVMVSRLMTVYLLGLMYSACVMIPAMIVYWVDAEFSVMSVAGGLVLLIDISLIDLVLSCLLGYVIARISLKLKNKSVVTALTAIAAIVLYYLIYFKINDLIRTMTQNAEQYGARIRGSAWVLYMFGAAGTGDLAGILLWTGMCAAAAAVTWLILKRSFLKIATSTGAVKKAVYRERRARQRSVSRALLYREFKRFTGSANYMLNCGMGIILLPAAGILLLWKGAAAVTFLSGIFGTDGAAFALCVGICLMCTAIDPAAPSVSLEGRTLWIARSMPVTPRQVLMAKLRLQFLLGAVPMVFALICAAAVLAVNTDVSPGTLILFIIFPLLFELFISCWDLVWGVRFANTEWTNEIYAIKQSLPVFLGLFGGWGIASAAAGIYFLAQLFLSGTVCLLILSALFAAASAGMLSWLRGEGAKCFAEL